MTTPAERPVPFWEDFAAKLAKSQSTAAQLAFLKSCTDDVSLNQALGPYPSDDRVRQVFQVVRSVVDFVGNEPSSRLLAETVALPVLGNRTIMHFTAEVLDEAELMQGLRDALASICPGCRNEIVDGQHYLRTSLELDTWDSDGLLPQSPRTVIAANVHHPGCLAEWTHQHALMQNVFAVRSAHG